MSPKPNLMMRGKLNPCMPQTVIETTGPNLNGPKIMGLEH